MGMNVRSLRVYARNLCYGIFWLVYHRCIYFEVCIRNEVCYVSLPHGGCGLHWRGRRHSFGWVTLVSLGSGLR